jgi:hypothetical protein
MRKVPMMMLSIFFVLLTACNKQEAAPASADQPHATVVMRDGSKVSGAVVASTPSDITIAADGGANRTISMKDVRSVTYDDSAPAAGAAAAPAARAAEPDSHENHYHPERAAIQTKTYTVPAGTEVSVRTEETIDSSTAAEGQTYAGEVTGDVLDADRAVVIPHGSNAQIMIKSASKGGRIRGASDLVLDLQSVSIGGKQYLLSTTDLATSGRDGIGENKRTAEFVGGGAVIGTLIGAIAGHGKGAAIGAGSGAGAGALTQVLTKGSAVKIEAETSMTFRLDQPLHVVERK